MGERSMQKQCTRMCCLALLAAVLPAPLQAAETGQEKLRKHEPRQLETVVVTAGGYEQLIADAPASISVLTREQLTKQPFHTLQDALRNVEGVTVAGGGVNKNDILIRGMPGIYTLILVDGMRQGTRENSLYEDAGVVQASQIPPLAAIERIEVVRGPMSSLYGSDAIGGVINVITRKLPERWGGSVNLDATVQQHSELGNRRGGDFYFAGPLKPDVLGLQFYGKYNARSEAERTDGSWDTEDQGATARLTVTPDERQKILLEAGWSQLERGATPGKSLATNNVQYFENQRTNFAVSHAGDWQLGTSTLSLYREIGKTHNELNDASTTNYPDNKLVNTIFDASLRMPLKWHTLLVGGQYLHGELSGLGNEVADSAGNRNTISAIDNSSWALFAEDEYRPLQRLALTAGLRYNHDERYSGNWSPRFYTVYHLSERLTLRGGIARAYRAPTLRQSSAEYSMTSGGGRVGVPVGVLPGNPDLKAETSTSSELGVRFESNAGVVASLTVFYNDFKNKIFSQCVSNCSGSSGALYAWGNIGNAEIRGIESSLQWPLSAKLKLAANYTYTDSQRNSDEETSYNGTSLRGQPLDRTPRHAFNARLDWQASPKLAAYAALAASSEQYWANFRNSAQDVRTRPGSSSYDIGGSYTFTSHLSLRLALLNITDKRVVVDSRNRNTGLDGNWQVDDGRRLWMSLGVDF
jgi:outer membrane receptor for ferrienterochelin and colicins